MKSEEKKDPVPYCVFDGIQVYVTKTKVDRKVVNNFFLKNGDAFEWVGVTNGKIDERSISTMVILNSCHWCKAFVSNADWSTYEACPFCGGR